MDLDVEVTMQDSNFSAQLGEGDIDMKNVGKVGTPISLYAMRHVDLFLRAVMLMLTSTLTKTKMKTLTKTKTTLPVLMGLDFL